MKPSRLLPLFLLAASAIGQVAVPAQEGASVATYNPRAIAGMTQSVLQGKLIKLEFVCRSSVTATTAGGGVTGEVLDSPGTRIKVNVEVPKEGADWFMHVPTAAIGGTAFTIYARFGTDKFGHPVARLLGRQLRPDVKGSRFEW